MSRRTSRAGGRLLGVATRSYGRRQRDPESIERVLHAAEGLIRTNRFHTTTMDELAAAAGVSRATVFNRFGSKLGVLQVLFTRAMEGPEMEAIRSALELEDPVASLDAVIEASCAIWESQGRSSGPNFQPPRARAAAFAGARLQLDLPRKLKSWIRLVHTKGPGLHCEPEMRRRSRAG